jgi:hypothetical protein
LQPDVHEGWALVVVLVVAVALQPVMVVQLGCPHVTVDAPFESEIEVHVCTQLGTAVELHDLLVDDGSLDLGLVDVGLVEVGSSVELVWGSLFPSGGPPAVGLPSDPMKRGGNPGGGASWH